MSLSISETEPSRIHSAAGGEARYDPDWALAATIAPWIAENGTKILAWHGSIAQYKYGTGYDTSDWKPWWQKGFICSPESGRIVIECDHSAEFAAMLARCGIPDDGPRVNSGSPGRYHLHFSGRGLSQEDWPVQGPVPGGDVKSKGFVPVSGTMHPNGTYYALARAGTEPPWLPEYTRGIEREREAMGITSGGSWDTSGSYGRNNALLDFKKELFYRFGLDEDDPDLIRQVLERNAEFGEPLAEAEVLSTVLRRKGYRRGWRLTDDLAGAMDGTPAQDTCLRLEKTTPLDANNPLELGKRPSLHRCIMLTAIADLKAKLAAELDEHVLSRDWDQRGGARGKQGYQWAMERLIRGEKVPVSSFEASLWTCLSKVSPNGAVLFTEDEAGDVIAWSDPAEPEPDESVRHPDYPGCPDDVNPMAGRYMTREEGQQAVIWAVQQAGGARASAKAMAGSVNRNREDLGLGECRWMRTQNFSRIHRELVKLGKLVLKHKEESYRKMHQWRTLPAAYVVPGPDGTPGKTRMSEAELAAHTREKLRDLNRMAA